MGNQQTAVWLGLPGAILLWPLLAQAQPIVPASEGTGTTVTQAGSTYVITGGSTSGSNLFHTFETFGLDATEVANFIAAPSIENILGQITGGSASIIDGLLQVSGSSANLYLINPSGILFGPNSALNLAGSFTATTASGLRFGDALWAVGSSTYGGLGGAPTDFLFNGSSGSLANVGNLAVGPHQSLMLLGGQVINTGSLSAPGGEITVAAVPGEHWVRISQTNGLLNLELATSNTQLPSTAPPLTPIDLPALLTGSTVQATQIAVNPDGTVRLGGSALAVPASPGTSLIAGQVSTAAATGTGGSINLLGRQVALVGATVSAEGAEGGGSIRVGGDDRGQGTIPNARALFVDETSSVQANALQQGNGGRIILWSDEVSRIDGAIGVGGGAIAGNGGFVETSSGGFLEVARAPDISAPLGLGGTWLVDPETLQIIPGELLESTNFTRSGNVFTAFPLGSITTLTSNTINDALNSGNVTILTQTGDLSFEVNPNDPVGVGLIFKSQLPGTTLTFSAAGNIFVNNSIFASKDLSLNLLADADNSGEGQMIGNSFIHLQGGNLLLTGNSSAGPGVLINNFLDTGGGNFTVVGNGPVTGTAIKISSVLFTNGGNISLTAQRGDIEVNTLDARGFSSAGDIDIATDRFFRATGEGSSKLSFSIAARGDSIQTSEGRAITIRHGGLGVIPFVVGDASLNGTAGGISNGVDRFSPTESYLPNVIRGNIALLTRQLNATTECLENCDFSEAVSEAVEEQAPSGVGNFSVEVLNDLYTTWQDLEDSFTQEFADYLELSEEPQTKIETVPAELQKVAAATGIKPALIYVSFVTAGPVNPQQNPSQSSAIAAPQADALKNSGQDLLELIVVTPSNPPVRIRLPEVTRDQVSEMAARLRREITDQTRLKTTSYLEPAQTLYRWLVAPLEADLHSQGISNLTFILDAGLRSLPIAALHDGQGFIVENYGVGLMPSLSLTDTRYTDIRGDRVLAMGASHFPDQPDLPAVPVELETVTRFLANGESVLNQGFTPEALVDIRRATPYAIVHLATHGEFKPGLLKESYIQFWNRKVPLDQIRTLNLNNPPLELLVLSACQMALGDQEAELGFAGLAVKAGVKTAIASLWRVSDVGTTGLMTEFYNQLQTAPIKAEALRQAQLAMIHGNIGVTGESLAWSNGQVALPDTLAKSAPTSLSHPYYWAAFTLVGTPW